MLLGLASLCSTCISPPPPYLRLITAPILYRRGRAGEYTAKCTCLPQTAGRDGTGYPIARTEPCPILLFLEVILCSDRHFTRNSAYHGPPVRIRYHILGSYYVQSAHSHTNKSTHVSLLAAIGGAYQCRIKENRTTNRGGTMGRCAQVRLSHSPFGSYDCARGGQRRVR